MTESNGVATWTAAAGIANSTTFTDSATDITIATAGDPVIYNDAGGTSNNVTTDCTDSDGTAMDGTADQVTCATPPVTTVTANSLDLNDFEDASALTDHPITINGGDDNDTVYGGALNDTLNGGAGGDDVEGGPGSDTVNGGDGNDDVYGSFCCGPGTPDGNDTITGGDGNDFASGGPGDDNVDLGAGDDSGSGGPGNDTIDGGDGNDADVKGGPGSDVVNGGAGNDSLFGDCAGSCNAGAPGNDTINGGDGNDSAQGEAGNDTIDMGAGDDSAWGDCKNSSSCSSGSPGDDTISGGDGKDTLFGQFGNDTVDGGAGDDVSIIGGPGNDVLHGGDGNDNDIEGASGLDIVDGGAGDDFIYESDTNGPTDYEPDVINGGPGFDEVEWSTGCSNNDLVTVSLDDQANDSMTPGSGSSCTDEADPNNNIGSDVEQIDVDAGNTPVIATGTAAVNVINTANGNDTVDPGPGSDTVSTFDGTDTVNAVDGYPDFIDCGRGFDTANVDQFDTTVNCETVNRSTVASAFATPEDAPPQVSWVSPQPAGKSIPSGTATTLEVAAADDHGISKVEFYVGTRLVCTVTAAPYRCSYLPQGADIGRDTLTAIAYDTTNQTATAQNQVVVPRFNARSLSARTRPAKDTAFPFKFTTTGKLALPANVSPADGCNGGFVVVQFRAGKKTISSRRVGLKKNCSYKSAVTFRIPARLHPKTLNVLVRFGGNLVMNPRLAKTRKVGVA